MKNKIPLPLGDLYELLWMARRYANRRSTFSPHTFNKLYQTLRDLYPEEIASIDKPDVEIDYWPWAQDGHYNPSTKQFDAIPVGERPSSPKELPPKEEPKFKILR